MASGERIRCFFLEPTGESRRYLRRYSHSSEGECPGRLSFHNADILIDVVPAGATSGDLHPHDDPRWPTHCACGYAFAAADEWQLSHCNLYVRRDTGEQMTLGDAPYGAMWFADWMGDDFRGPDGHCLVIKTPGGEWTVDGGYTAQGKRSQWQRTGAPPNITANPSIGIGWENGQWKYHGWLRDGWLVEC